MSRACYVPVTVPKNHRDAALAATGSLLVLAALALIWAARATIPYNVYVSELGADDMPTRYVFMGALLCLVAGGALIAWAARHVHAGAPILALWTPSVSLWVACGLFLFASQVTCSPGCPVPVGDDFHWQDLLHIVAAVLAFALACWAMLQAAFARRRRTIAILSQTAAWSVAAIAGAGGLMSLLRFAVDLGSWLEFVATTIAIAWVVMLGATLAAGWSRSAGGASRNEPLRRVLDLPAGEVEAPLGAGGDGGVVRHDDEREPAIAP